MSKLIIPIEDVAQLVVDAGFTGWQVVTGTAIIGAESRFDAYAVNVIGEEFRADGTPNRAYRSLDVGLFQVNTFWHPAATIVDLLDPVANARWARMIFTQGFNAAAGKPWGERVAAGWSAWITYRKGLHLPFESEAAAAARAIGVKV